RPTQTLTHFPATTLFRSVQEQTWTAGEVNDNSGQCFIQRHIGVAVTADALFVAHGLLEGLAEGDADVFHGVVVVDFQVTLAGDIQIHHAVTGDLIHHVIKEGHAGVKAGFAGSVEIDLNGNLGFKGISLYPSLTFGHGDSVVKTGLLPKTMCSRIIPVNTAGVPQWDQYPDSSERLFQVVHVSINQAVELVLDHRADGQFEQAW